jgi:hypothetical protein
MKIQFIWTVLILASALLMRSDTWARDPARHWKTLAGVPSVYILVEELPDELQQAGLSRATLQTDAELRLCAAGIRVATEQEGLSLLGSPLLYVKVQGGRNITTTGIHLGYVAAVVLQFFQDVRLDRDPSIRVEAPTWSAMQTITGPTVEVIRQSVRDLADRFANAYLMANPKR